MLTKNAPKIYESIFNVKKVVLIYSVPYFATIHQSGATANLTEKYPLSLRLQNSSS